MTKRALIWFVPLAAALLLWMTGFRVAENEYAVLTRFGKPRAPIAEAGLYFKWPPPIDSLTRVSGKTHVLDPEANEYLTGDKKNVIVDAFLAWRVADPLKYLTSVSGREGAEARLTELLQSTVGDVLSNHEFAHLVSHDTASATTLDDVHGALTRAAAPRAIEDFGIEVAAVRIKRLNFPRANKAAVFQRMEAERQRIAGEYRAEGQELYEKRTADADLESAELLAAAEQRAREIRGEADAEVARIYQEAYARNPELFAFLRALEVLEAAVDEESTLILPADHELLRVLSEPPALDEATDQ